MKLFKFLFIALFSATMISCEEDTSPDAPKPTLDVTELGTGIMNDDITVAPGATLSFKWNALRTGSGAKLLSFELLQNGSNVTFPLPQTNRGEDLPITNLPNAYESQYVDTLVLPAGMNAGVTTYTFTLEDEDGNVVERVIDVTVSAALANENTGSFYHIFGSLEGSYDLVADALVGAAGAATSKDLQNTDAVGAAFTGSFTAANTTKFVKSNSYDYANANEQSAMAAYAAGTASATVTNPAVGDIYIAKLRGGSDYVAIKITALDANDNTCSCVNKGKITFSYKKK